MPIVPKIEASNTGNQIGHIFNRLKNIISNSQATSDTLLTIAEEIRQDAIQKAPTKKIKDAIEISPVSKSLGEYRISISVNLNIAPEGAAFEYGSGIHRRDNPDKYSIFSSAGKQLKFFWEKEGRMFIGPQVMHPGVEAKPYLRPAIDAHKEELKQRLQFAVIKEWQDEIGITIGSI